MENHKFRSKIVRLGKKLYFCATNSTIMEKIKHLKQLFDDFLSKTDLTGNPKGLYEPIAYTLLQSGKRIRPMFCLLANDLFGGDEKNALWSALALETVHNSTLIHDDIMDQAPLRRGRETVYKKWNLNQAILSGDVALVMTYDFATHSTHPTEIVNLLCHALLQVCEGQQMDLEFETQPVVTIPEYMEMIRLKTAVLLAVSLQIGATVAEAKKADIQHIYDFGIALGMSFQLQDDILDLYSDVEVFGKRHGGDIVDNKKTYLYLKALELADEKDRNRLTQLFSMNIDHDEEEKIEEVKAIYDRLHVKEAAETVMAEYDKKAYEALDAIDLPNERKVHLRTYAELLSGRKK